MKQRKVKKRGAEIRMERFESNIQYAPVTDKAFDGKLCGALLADEVGQFAKPDKEWFDEVFSKSEQGLINSRNTVDGIGNSVTVTVSKEHLT